jgi:hypothetical protein
MFCQRPQRPLHFRSHLSFFDPCSSPSALSLPALPFLALALFPLSNFLFFPAEPHFFVMQQSGEGKQRRPSCTLQGAQFRRESIQTP